MGQLPRSLVLGMGLVKQLSLIDGIYDGIEKVGVCLLGGFKYLLCSPLPGEMIQFD